jgi:ATP-dependent RNA helicase RhlE
MSFDALGLTPELLRAVADQGYTEPTPVQRESIPAILAGRDILAGAQTGTGKTAAFVLPMLQLLNASRTPGWRAATPSAKAATPSAKAATPSAPSAQDARDPRDRRSAESPPVRALVLTPTRELALQVEESVRVYGAHRRIRSVAIYGGVGYEPQNRALRAGPGIVVATPGRLLDHIGQGHIDLSRLEILVLDEADRMLDMGFIRDIRKVIELLPRDRQTLLFSATFSDDIRQLAGGILRDPVMVQVTPRNTATELVTQVVHPVDRERKRELLSHLIRSGRIEQALVFTLTKLGANRLAEQLGRDGIAAAAIHGNKSQGQRVRALTDFKAGRVSILVATEVAARGIDIEELPHVVNFELPMVPEDYLHRIGRTGRAGSEGDAISLVCVDEDRLLRDIESLLGRRIDVEIVPGYEPDRSIRPQAIRLRTGTEAAPRGPRPSRGPRPPFAAPAPGRGAPGFGGGIGVGFGARPQGSRAQGARPQGSRPQDSRPHRNVTHRGQGAPAPARPANPWRNGAPPPVNPSAHGPRPAGGSGRPAAFGNRPFTMPGERLARPLERPGRADRRA